MIHQLSALAQLKTFSTVVADTSDFMELAKYQATDATTNPSLILKTLNHPAYQAECQTMLDEARRRAPAQQPSQRMEWLLALMGCKILQHIPGRVSTEVDARLSFDMAATVTSAERIIQAYENLGISKERVLIKIAGTWEGIQAARCLEQSGIHCNITLVFSLIQAATCADAGVRLISPFVGRIWDWEKQRQGVNWDDAKHRGIADPGVQAVTAIFHYLKQHRYPVEIMAASFRNLDQILALAGCDLLTIAPNFLQELQQSQVLVKRQLQPTIETPHPDKLDTREIPFRYALNDNAMATEKLAEGIRLFARDTVAVESRF